MKKNILKYIADISILSFALIFILSLNNIIYAYDYNNVQYQQFLKEAQEIKTKTFNSQNNNITQNSLQNILGSENYNIEDIGQYKKENKISNLLIFISFSMPDNLIKEYIQQAKKAGAVLVLRGMIDQSISKTAIKLNTINNKQGVNAIIDPNLFKLYNITKVPTIVLAQYEGYPCLDCKQSLIYDKISGSISLEYALEQIINSKFSNTKNIAKEYISNLRNRRGIE